MTRRRWVLVGTVIAIAIAIAIVWQRRDESPRRDTSADRPRQPGGSVRLGSGGPAAARAPTTDLGPRRLPPPPPGFDPGSTPTDPGDPRMAEALARGELPVVPPGFADAALREQFRAWWLAEGARRAEVYRQRFPSDTLPNDEETRRLLDEMYDAGEPPRDGEDADAVDARHQVWFERWQDFTAAYGETPHGVFGYGGDRAFGVPTPPPVLPGGSAPVPDTTRPHTEDNPDAPRTPIGPAGPR